MNEVYIRSLSERFGITDNFLSYKQMAGGHINSTYLVRFKNADYVIQSINTFVYQNPKAVMDNISAVTSHIRNKISASGGNSARRVLEFRKCDNGEYFLTDQNGCWRCCRFIDNSICYNKTDNLKVIEEAGKAYGEFQMLLKDFPAGKLNITIKNFHNTPKRFKDLELAVSRDKSGRAYSALSEIKAFYELKGTATKMYTMQETGELPVRVTHNDTKINNVLFDKNTGEHLAVIDLDTVMPGLVGFDFGDTVRSVANTCDEDEKDITNIKFDLIKFDSLTKGFSSAVGGTLNKKEKETPALGAVSMTIECGIRFLTDFLCVDEYFKTDYPEHNLHRARCQLTLAKEMLNHFDEMNEIVQRYFQI